MFSKFNQVISWTFLVSYVIGKGLQFFAVGPPWLRWHLSDLGFVACVSLFPEILFRGTRFEGALMRHQKKVWALALTVALVSEALQKTPDPTDLLCFVLGAIPPILYIRSR